MIDRIGILKAEHVAKRKAGIADARPSFSLL
jgi:hypothetical protein